MVCKETRILGKDWLRQAAMSRVPKETGSNIMALNVASAAEPRERAAAAVSEIDQEKLNAFLARAIGDLSAGYGGVMVSLGIGLASTRQWPEPVPLARQNSRLVPAALSATCANG